MDRTIIVVPHAIELEPLARGLVELGHAVRQLSVASRKVLLDADWPESVLGREASVSHTD
jgi:hypothetical protein